ncbi:MAG TPA: PP2C family serine/threonine-protein phosphatase, partial [Pirellulales bacterium]|nr:PP2C family serine/threonine-protein phosphatase [Pirellulales bacterium]
MHDESLTFEQCVRHAAISDIGMRRQNNQDSMNTVVAPERSYWEQRGHLYLVADGMGAHAAGELASKLAADGLPHIYAKHTDLEPALALRQAILEANNKIYEKGHANAEFQGMGTTCSALVLLPVGAIVGHVGDSRVYRLRDGKLEQLTFDHSLVWEMRAAGQIPANAENIHVPKNIITRSLGPNPVVKIDLEGPFPMAVGDRFLLCSDGLTGPVTDPELGAILASMSPDEAVQMLVDLANLRGGPDNITVIVVEVVGLPAEAVVDEPEDEKRSTKLLIVLALIGLVAMTNASFWFLPLKLAAFLSSAAVLAAVIVAVLRYLDSDTGPDIPIMPS